MLLQVKDLYKLLSKLGLKEFCTLSKHLFVGCTKYHAQKQLPSNTLKKNELKVYISFKENKSACFAIHDLVHDF